jgi:hypothetical protein
MLWQRIRTNKSDLCRSQMKRLRGWLNDSGKLDKNEYTDKQEEVS